MGCDVITQADPKDSADTSREARFSEQAGGPRLRGSCLPTISLLPLPKGGLWLLKPPPYPQPVL